MIMPHCFFRKTTVRKAISYQDLFHTSVNYELCCVQQNTQHCKPTLLKCDYDFYPQLSAPNNSFICFTNSECLKGFLRMKSTL